MRIFFQSRTLLVLIFLFSVSGDIYAQQGAMFKQLLFAPPQIVPYDLYASKEGIIWISSSSGLWYLNGGNLKGPIIVNHDIYKVNYKVPWKSRSFPWKRSGDYSFRPPGVIGQGFDKTMYFVTGDTIYFWRNYNDIKNFSSGLQTSPFKILIDDQDIIYKAGEGIILSRIEIQDSLNSQRTLIKKLKKISTWGFAGNNSIHCLARDQKIKNRIWCGTDRGLCYFNYDNETIVPILSAKNKTTVTEIYTEEENKIWFSTLEKGMGVYDLLTKTFNFYPYKTKRNSASAISTFCYKAPNEFFIAASDSLPAIFNTKTHDYFFINDSAFTNSPNITSDIKVTSEGKIVIIKGGTVYYGSISNDTKTEIFTRNDSLNIRPFISALELSNNTPLATLTYHPELLKRVVLNYDQNDLIVHFTLNGFHNQERILLEWRVEGDTSEWNWKDHSLEGPKILILPNLGPGKYSLEIRLRTYDARWQSPMAKLDIIIKPAYWKTRWFWTAIILGIGLFMSLIMWWRGKVIKKRERLRFVHEKQLLELEAKALRAQMNPHFIFNCLNSIKSLIQQHDEEKSITYLTTFSKLIRNLFNNADKKGISLYDEIETCKLYLQLEAMRFDTKFSYAVNVDENIDLKSIQVPALIIQPFIENSIWHGIVPRNSGGNVSLNVLRKDGIIEVVIDDDGIGREASAQNKSASGLAHQSKGVNLTQTRLELNNLLQQRQAELEVIDKKDINAMALGTMVILKFKESE